MTDTRTNEVPTCPDCGEEMIDRDRLDYEREAGFTAGYPRICGACADSLCDV